MHDILTDHYSQFDLVCYVAGDNDEELDKLVTDRIVEEAMTHRKRIKRNKTVHKTVTDESAMREVNSNK